jgi:predicted ester cyclase
MAEADREAHYRRYISYLNDRRVDELGEFVQEELAYNGKPMTRLDYQNMIAGDIAAIPDLYFDIHLLVIDGDQIACRLNFQCTPQSEFLGLQPNGKSISFSEHVFYRLRGGKIYEVWSLIDRPAIEEQLAS